MPPDNIGSRFLRQRDLLDIDAAQAQLVAPHLLHDFMLRNSTSRTDSKVIDLPMPADRYTLTARKLRDNRVELNGIELAVAADGKLPVIKGEHIPAGRINLAPASITFLVIADARNRYCR